MTIIVHYDTMNRPVMNLCSPRGVQGIPVPQDHSSLKLQMDPLNVYSHSLKRILQTTTTTTRKVSRTIIFTWPLMSFAVRKEVQTTLLVYS